MVYTVAKNKTKDGYEYFDAATGEYQFTVWVVKRGNNYKLMCLRKNVCDMPLSRKDAMKLASVAGFDEYQQYVSN